jgi:hypothetical protein
MYYVSILLTSGDIPRRISLRLDSTYVEFATEDRIACEVVTVDAHIYVTPTHRIITKERSVSERGNLNELRYAFHVHSSGQLATFLLRHCASPVVYSPTRALWHFSLCAWSRAAYTARAVNVRRKRAHE